MPDEKLEEKSLRYMDDFYIKMFRLSHDQGMTYAQAYRSLGYDTGELGERRAIQAGYRSGRFVMERFCNGIDDGLIDMNREAGLTMRDFDISKAVIDDINFKLSEKEKFLEQVISKRFDFMDSKIAT